MGFNFTNMIDKLLKGAMPGKRGEQISRLYHAYLNPVNFAIVCAIGVLLYFVVGGIFQIFGWIGIALSWVVAWFWIWSQSVGPFGHLWGFSEKKTKSPKPKTKAVNASEVV